MGVVSGYPRVEIRLAGIEHNARNLVGKCKKFGAEITGVTKGACGHPDVARSMLKGGVTRLGDSRLLNLERLKDAGVATDLVLIRIPMLSEAARVPLLAAASLNSEVEIIRALGEAASALGRTHGIILMVDVGERREGIPPDEVLRTCKEIVRMKGVRLEALGTNVACFNGVLPTRENVQILVDLARDVGREIGQEVGVSGGSTATTILFEKGEMPTGVTELRIGEGILLGTDISYSRPIPGAVQDTFTLVAEAVEVRDRPSMPEGIIGYDSFGGKPVFIDRGMRRRAIAAIGKQDVEVAGVTPVDQGIEIAGASSDHLILDVTSAEKPVRVGDKIGFRLNYPAALRLMTSAYVEKVLV